MKTCYQKHVMDLCGCADSAVEQYSKAFRYRNYTICDARDPIQGRAFLLMLKIITGLFYC